MSVDPAERVIFHADFYADLLLPATYSVNAFTKLCRRAWIRHAMGRVGCGDSSRAEALFRSTE